MKPRLGIILLGLLFGAASCSSVSLPSLPSWPWSTPAVQPNATAEALFEEGMTYFNNKKYALAIDRFQKVKAEFPFSPQLTEAELKVGEAYYLNKQYPEAASAFKEFQTLHPRNENTPFVAYHLGLVHFDQFTSVDRDQKLTAIAKGYFENVIKDYPNSPYVGPAKEKLAKCIEYLSEHEFQIASFYFREKKYRAAIDRLESILRNYRESTATAKALYYLGESYRLEKNTVKATLAYEAFLQYFPEDPLAKTAQGYLSEMAKEKQDPLAMLLKRDGRPHVAPSLPDAGREKELNLVAKKEVVYEEPGEEKGMFRRVVDTLNPFASSSDKKESGSKKIATAEESNKKEESNGFFGSLWRGLNPFAREENTKIATSRDPQLVNKIDDSLNQRGVDTSAQSLVSKAPASDLPKEVEATPPPTNTAELLGQIDTKLSKEGKEAGQLPTPPEAAPFFKAANTEGQKPVLSRTESAASPNTSGLITGIDEALKRKGVDPTKLETPVKSADAKTDRPGTSGQSSAVSSQEKIELAPKLTFEKGPLFLGTSEHQGEDKAKEGQASEPSATQPAKSAEPPRDLPQAVMKNPSQPFKEKAPETKVAEKKKAPAEEDESKGALEQLKEDLGKLRDILNPFGW